VENPRIIYGWLYKRFPRNFCQSRSSVCLTSSYSFFAAMNTDPVPPIDPGERDELDDIFHHLVNETGTDPTADIPEIPEPEQPDVPGPEQPGPPGPQPPVQPEVPRPGPPQPPVDSDPPRPGAPHDSEGPKSGPPRHPEGPVRPEQPHDPRPPRDHLPPRNPEPPRDPLPPRDPEPPRGPERPHDPERPYHPEPPRDPEPPRNPEGPLDPDRPADPGPPERPVDPLPPLNPDPPRGPEQPRQPCVPVDCLPAGCVLTDTAFMAGLAGAMAAFTACLAVVGLYVVVRYIAPYLLASSLVLLLMAILYTIIRRPEDARRLRRFLAERGREALGRLWGWATQRPEVRMLCLLN
jgi:hypothetical protein